MKEMFIEIIKIYKTHVRIKQLKRKTIENFSRFYVSFIDQDKDSRNNKDKYLQLKRLGLQYIQRNQDLIYTEINK